MAKLSAILIALVIIALQVYFNCTACWYSTPDWQGKETYKAACTITTEYNNGILFGQTWDNTFSIEFTR